MAVEISYQTQLLCQVSVKSVDHNFWPLEHFLRQCHLSVLVIKNGYFFCLASLGVSLVQQHGGFVPRESLAKSSELGNLATNTAVIHLTTFELSANKKRTLLWEEIHRSLL